ncbi:hypothetical protein Ato02nite_008720 [Paractinoplanes toevensis]|uniref:Uncharacterized protein n=1 Tax=Paractinoplanes toevensis TaxID=571911 RepID=A0A919T496_9ACTN|nr:hypothetical protein Ato02nite_008720 [Actinoplanes toevensis]
MALSRGVAGGTGPRVIGSVPGGAAQAEAVDDGGRGEDGGRGDGETGRGAARSTGTAPGADA